MTQFDKFHRDEETHDQLLQAFREYFKLNQVWLEDATQVSGMKTRQCLSKIRDLCFLRRKIIMDWRYEVNDFKVARKNQNQSEPPDIDDN
jgi:hypothetical protein